MSPAVEFDNPEAFTDWAEDREPVRAQPEDYQTKELQEELHEYVKTQKYSDSLERMISRAGLLARGKSGGIFIARTRFSPRHKGIRSILHSAYCLTKLDNNWDDEGSPGYSIETWRRVRKFLLRQTFVSETFFRKSLPIPQINPADHGSIDVFWRMKSRQLLLNFPSDEQFPITYYGRDETGNNTVTGRTAGGELRPDLVAWLIQTTK